MTEFKEVRSEKYKVAIVQMESSENKQENLERSLRFVQDAGGQGAKLVVFPEFLMAFSPSRQSAKQLATVAESIDGDFVRDLRDGAKRRGVYVLATTYERSGVPNRVYDTAALIGPGGELRGAYRKLHLYDAFGFKESEKFVAGDKVLSPIATELGRIGVMICYDLRFPEHARLLALGGAQIILIPSGWVFGPMKEEHWFAMLKTRAIENGVYVVAPAQTGNIYTGRSALVDPFGIVQNDLGQGERIIVAEIDLHRVEEARRVLPLLKNRREDVYRLTSRSASTEPEASAD